MSAPVFPSSSGRSALRHCYFCTSEMVKVCFGIGAVYHVECPSCLASGPHAKNEATAADAWNRGPSGVAQGQSDCGAGEVNLPTLDEYRNNLIEECAKIAEPWAGFWLRDSSTEADRAAVAVRTEIAAKIRGLAIPSTSRATGPLVPWELDCQRAVCAAPECECPVASTDRELT